ncbi:MAG: hypothetical protein HZB13_18675 [Acidobacteria bacterium]|nr:hypothetical protein [Acidobacteriota bacterium]
MSGESSNLRNALRALAAEDRHARAAESVRAALREELTIRRRRRKAAIWWPAAAAACLAVGVWLGLPKQETQIAARPAVESVRGLDVQPSPAEAVPPPARTLTRLASAGGARPAEPAGVRPVSPWYFYTGLPLPGPGQVLPVEVSADLAARFGVYTAGQSVRAQIFIGDDGLARAIRFVR